MKPDIDSFVELAKTNLQDTVGVELYDYAPCYLWYDRKLFNAFGEAVDSLPGNTIYLYRHSGTYIDDLFHELGHAIARKLNIVGHQENGYIGSWECQSRSLIGKVRCRRHWSEYLNLYAMQGDDFKMNSASELWAELFMIWYCYPHMDECRFIESEMQRIQTQPEITMINQFANLVFH